MPNRIIKETIKRSPEIDSLSWFEEVVFYRIIVTADDYGCLDGRTILLKNELFPTKDTVTKKAVADAVAKLASVGLLCEYTVNGMPYLYLPTWERHQRVRNKRRKYPEPPANTRQSIDGQMTASCPPESESESNPESYPESNPESQSQLPRQGCGCAQNGEKKICFAENVTMTNEEYQKLLDAYGLANTARLIEMLDNYKGSSGKSYKNDYKAILGWCVKRLNEEKQASYRGMGNNALQPPQLMTPAEQTANDQLMEANRKRWEQILSTYGEENQGG